jgi:hydroxymethylbilane synthase
VARAAVLRAATRGSPLARWQTDYVAGILAVTGVDVDPLIVSTTGDLRQDVSLAAIGGQGVFVKEVQAAVLDGRADIAVHSAKDLPSEVAPGLVLAAVPLRGDPRDALVGGALAGLPTGALVATGSVRRRAQLAYLRPDLTFAELRGNIATRLSKLESEGFDAIVMAAAALQRLGIAERITELLDVSLFIPQVAQGALAVECRAGDEVVIELLASIEDADSRTAVDAERAFLAELGGGCTLPVGAHAVVAAGGLTLTGMLASSDGRVLLRETRTGPFGPDLGREVARYLLTEAGGSSLLDAELA